MSPILKVQGKGEVIPRGEAAAQELKHRITPTLRHEEESPESKCYTTAIFLLPTYQYHPEARSLG